MDNHTFVFENLDMLLDCEKYPEAFISHFYWTLFCYWLAILMVTVFLLVFTVLQARATVLQRNRAGIMGVRSVSAYQDKWSSSSSGDLEVEVGGYYKLKL